MLNVGVLSPKRSGLFPSPPFWEGLTGRYASSINPHIRVIFSSAFPGRERGPDAALVPGFFMWFVSRKLKNKLFIPSVYRNLKQGSIKVAIYLQAATQE